MAGKEKINNKKCGEEILGETPTVSWNGGCHSWEMGGENGGPNGEKKWGERKIGRGACTKNNKREIMSGWVENGKENKNKIRKER